MAGNEQAPDTDEQTCDPGTAAPLDPATMEAIATVEAILFASDSPLTVSKISSVAELAPGVIRNTIASLNDRYEKAGSAFRIESIANGYQMLTLPEYHDVLGRVLRARSQSRLSQAAMETLAIVAYRQPVIRADIEAIRGVACGDLLRGLMEKGLIKIVGRAQVLGRPMLYGTTRRFLEVFGLGTLDDLPRVEELRSGAPKAGEAAASEPAGPEPADSPTTQSDPPADEPLDPQV